ncbi:hypothetical protein QAD02_011785 [Eretmocerus hayati]|uniref:Uncharacterized protein n=1 Tax=Eretmocerus hayati TaxID=131215 RepID=A0ACC2NXI9_9HYME|nr:hypothetical protein QAD02_011785 [Eretmocerus hayati]
MTEPVNASSKAQPIEIVEAGEGPQPGTQATILAIKFTHCGDPLLEIHTKNVTLITPKHCRMSFHDRLSSCNQYLWVENPGNSCVYGLLSVLLMQGKLAGMEIPRSPAESDRTVKGFSNIAQNRTEIENLLKFSKNATKNNLL